MRGVGAVETAGLFCMEVEEHREISEQAVERLERRGFKWSGARYRPRAASKVGVDVLPCQQTYPY